MSDYDVRVLADSELREAQTVFRRALHHPKPSDEEWEKTKSTLAPDRFMGAVADGVVAGTTYVFPSSIALPGGNVVPMAAVSRVGVRGDHTRRGVLTELMRFQLADAKARGEIVATLYASESAIYGRFGYGIASYARVLKLRGARVRPEVPRAGQVRLLTDVAEALAVVPGLYERIGLHRPGMMSRGPDWWVRLAGNSSGAAIVHTGPDGDDGFALYTVESMDNPAEPDHDNRLTVLDLHAANTGAFNDLWRFVLGVDLIGEVRVHNRPLDEHVELLLVDSRKCRTDDVGDELWARLVDVPEALAARSYGDAEPVVIKVNDQFLPDNSGTYGISPFGATRVSGDPALVLDVDVLAMIYLGAVKPSGLAAAGRLQVIDPDAVARADKLFASDQIAWCGTGF